MTTPTLPRIDLQELGFEEPVIPCEMYTAAAGNLRTPMCNDPAKYLIIFHNHCCQIPSCEKCWKLYQTLVDAMMIPETLRCAVCKTAPDPNKPLFYAEPL